ncbi:MAG: TatD family hydrolase, partial [Candidatus Dormibacteria bacterium]
QLRYARARRLPAIFHQRDAWDDFAAIVRAEGEGIRGVVHCFTGDARQAKIIVEEFGFRLGIGGVVTFRNAEPVRRAVRAIGLGHLILETDCPYLAPTPQRGRRNEPAFMPYVAEQLAQLFETDVDEVAAATNRNARELFGDGPAS